VSERLEDRLARLERERQEADRRYNDALTALDAAMPGRVELPAPPASYDASRLPDANQAWDLPHGPSAAGSLKRRVAAFVWRALAPIIDTQRRFNAAVVDHLNRNVAAHEDTKRAADALIGRLSEHIESQIQFQARLLALLQTVTGYVDTKDRAMAGGQDILNAGMSAINDGWLKRWESLGVREQRFVERLAAIDDLRQTTSLAHQTALSLKREVERLISGTTGTTGTTDPRNELTQSSSVAAALTGADGKQRQPAAEGTREDQKKMARDSSFQVPVVPVVPVVPDLESFKYLGFEDQFRGSVDDIRRRLEAYVTVFAGQRDVLDVGCGRGEFLELLRERGIAARGVDMNHAMVEACRARGLDVAEGDALGHVASLADGSLGGIFAAQVVEHLAPDYLMAFLETAAHKLRPNGLLVLETINPACWLAFFESYIRDLTHVRPLHPETLQYLLRASGLHDVRIEYKSPVDPAAKLDPIRLPETTLPPATADIVQTFNENVAKLNARLFTFQDYAVIGRK
jgi:SAM-dependent methyltransferase